MNTSQSTGEDETPEESMGEESEEEPTGEMERITRGRGRDGEEVQREGGEGEGEGEEEEEGGAEDEEDNQLLWTNLTRTKGSRNVEL